MILHKQKEEFRDLIEASAKYFKISNVYIEKDYWVTYLLKKLRLSKYIDTAIFKGGTSLSKAYKIINRFSEDIDLAIISEDLSSNQTKTLMKNIEKAILDDNFKEIINSQTSKGSKFRKTVYEYPKITKGLFGHANENLILELNSFAQPHPFIQKEISTYIYEFLSKQNDDAKALIEEYDIEPFSINILDYKRTFCEKISSIAKASYEDDENYTQTKSKIRHFYDIYFLIQEQDIKLFIQSDDFIEMLKKVKQDDKIQFDDSWTDVLLSSSKIFQEPQGILNKLETFYEKEFKVLVYENTPMPSINEIKSKILTLSKILKKERI